jgi:hypothetical protein
MTDREEAQTSATAGFSPGGVSSAIFCGEVAVLSWGDSPLHAALTKTTAPDTYLNGWASFTLPPGSTPVPSSVTKTGYAATPSNAGGPGWGLPVTGFAAINAINAEQGGQSYGFTWPLRW